MKLRKITAVLAAALLTMTAMTACSGGAASSASSETPSSESSAASAESASSEETTGGDMTGEITVLSREDGSGTRGAFIELFGFEHIVAYLLASRERNSDGRYEIGGYQFVPLSVFGCHFSYGDESGAGFGRFYGRFGRSRLLFHFDGCERYKSDGT